jgi:hypothetical protein
LVPIFGALVPSHFYQAGINIPDDTCPVNDDERCLTEAWKKTPNGVPVGKLSGRFSEKNHGGWLRNPNQQLLGGFFHYL